MNDGNPKPPIWYRVLDFVQQRVDRVAERLANLAEFLEWVFGSVTEFFSKLLLMPIRWLVGSRVVAGAERAQFALVDHLMGIFYRVRDTMGHVVVRVFPPQLFWPFYWMFDGVLMSFDFFAEWYYTRDYKKLLYGIPAAMLSVPLIVALVLGTLYTPSAKIRYYERARRQALIDENPERAEFLQARLVQLGSRNLEKAEFESAMMLVQNRQMDEALEKLQALAPLSEPGFAPAHLYLVANLLDGRMSVPNAWPIVRKHLDHVLELEPNQPWARRFLVECQLHDQQIPEAIENMEALRKTFPDLSAELAYRQAALGNRSEARKAARQAILYFEETLQPNYAQQVAASVLPRELLDAQRESLSASEPVAPVPQVTSEPEGNTASSVETSQTPAADNRDRSKADPTTGAGGLAAGGGKTKAADPSKPGAILTPNGYLRMANAYQLVGNSQRQMELLQEGLQAHPDSLLFKTELMPLVAPVLKSFDLSDELQRQQVELLLLIDPTHERALSELFARMRQQKGGDAERVIAGLIAHPQSPANLVKAMGDMYLATDLFDKAKAAYQRACQLDQASGYAWNNLAWIWSNVAPIDMDRALECTELAMKAKRDANFYETRGQILVKLQRWEEAARYLERALNASIPNPEDAHRSLADIYTELGKLEKAAAHRASVDP